MFAKVLKSTGKEYLLELDNFSIVKAKLRGKIRLKDIDSTNPIAVGDTVLLSNEIYEDNYYTITEICNRKNYIVRKSTNLSKQKQILASNIDLAIIVFTLKEPKTHLLFLDRILVSLESFRIPTIILFNKFDIYNDNDKNEIKNLFNAYEKINYKCYEYSIYNNKNKDIIIDLLNNKQVLIAGNSGVGKSSFINSLDQNINLKAGEISSINRQGKHTTTFAEMHKLSFNSYIIDTPGIRAFGLYDLEKNKISHYFPEMRKLIGECKYYNCLHINEPNCAIKSALKNGGITQNRYHSYLQILSDENDVHRRDKYK